MIEALVQIHRLSKTYKRGKESIEVLRKIQLTIHAGDFYAFMGPSGSGKSTLLNIIAGLDAPTSGELLFKGQRIDQKSEDELARWRSENVGFIFQFYNLLPMLSAQKNVEVPLLLVKGMSSTERTKRATLALSLVGLRDRLRHKPGELSGGQQQRVSIARAIVSDPSMLVCDEPTGDLDRQSATDVLTLLQKLNADYGKTIIMVTHDPKAAGYAKQTIHLDKGCLVTGEAVEESGAT
jgi:putative ABC transport system ATP-binding protein